MADGEGDADAALDSALARMPERGYAEKCRDRGEPVHLLGLACGREARNLLEISGPNRPERAVAPLGRRNPSLGCGPDSGRPPLEEVLWLNLPIPLILRPIPRFAASWNWERP